MTAASFIGRLEGVRTRGDGQFLARCPAHDDRSPSLSVREIDDGTILVKCFSGCTAFEIVAAVGLELHDLFPPRLPDQPRPRRQRHHLSVRDVVEILHDEFLLVQIVAADVAAGRAISSVDRDRLATARQRIARIHEVLA